MTAILLLLVAVAVVVGVIITAAALVQGNWRGAARRGAAVVTTVAVYAVALIGVGVTSPVHQLAIGETKCFDDWCVALRSVAPVEGRDDLRALTVVVSSRARRIRQRPDHPVASLVTAAGTAQVVVPGLDQQLGPGQDVELHATLAIPADARQPELVVTEGGWPSRLVIGDENSPWHARSGWLL